MRSIEGPGIQDSEDDADPAFKIGKTPLMPGSVIVMKHRVNPCRQTSRQNFYLIMASVTRMAGSMTRSMMRIWR